MGNHDDKTITFGPNGERWGGNSTRVDTATLSFAAGCELASEPHSFFGSCGRITCGRANPNILASFESAGSHVVESSSELMVYKVSEILAIMQTQVASMSQ